MFSSCYTIIIAFKKTHFAVHHICQLIQPQAVSNQKTYSFGFFGVLYSKSFPDSQDKNKWATYILISEFQVYFQQQHFPHRMFKIWMLEFEPALSYLWEM